MKENAIEEVNALMKYNYAAHRLLSINKSDSLYSAMLLINRGIVWSDCLIIDFTDLCYGVWLDICNQTYFNEPSTNNDNGNVGYANYDYYDYSKS